MKTTPSLQDCPIETPFGTLQARWTEAGLASFCFVRAGDAELQMQVDNQRGVSLRAAVDAYLNKGWFDYAFDTLDLRELTEFTIAVLRQCHQIPPGETRTYGQLAAQAGSPMAARAVGIVMAKNRWPILIPCHRVVGTSGKLTGYSGVGGVATKRRLLDFERGRLGLDLF